MVTINGKLLEFNYTDNNIDKEMINKTNRQVSTAAFKRKEK